ncbi:autophagy- protein 2 [Gryganskiella cystojenkinii]|nr:autophagy- protein 2 [Gryganskiella cystojenkinii]
MKAWSLGNFFSSLALPAGLQKRLVSFLLQRAIGHFLQDDLDLEKLDIELSNGIVHLTDLKLNTVVLNDLVASTPLAVTQGRIGSITATIPWRNLWNGQCVLEINGIDITLAPVKAQAGRTQDLEEQLRSSTVNLANEFLHQRTTSKEEEALQESLLHLHTQTMQTPSGFPGDFNARPSLNASATFPSQQTPGSIPESSGEEPSETEGTQFVAKLIEKLMARIQIICRGTTIRLKHSSSLTFVQDAPKKKSKDEKLDYEFEIRLPYIHYRDDTPGWDQSGPGMDASSVRSTSSGLDSVSSSAMLDESVIPSVIWQDTPESIKTVVFKGFSVWIKQQGALQEIVNTAQSTATEQPLSPAESYLPEQEMSDSDEDVFSDAQETLSQSVMSSRMEASKQISRSTYSAPKTPVRAECGADLYQAEIFSTLQHRNRLKINIRKNATMISSLSNAPPAQSTARSLLDMDFHIRSILIAISPAHISFIMEILSLMEHATPPEVTNLKTQVAGPDPHHSNPINIREANLHGHGAQSDPRVDQAYHGSLPFSESFGDRLHGQRPMSPKRGPNMDQLRSLQNKSPGGRPLDRDRHYDSKKPRPPIPTPAMYMDASRFLSGSSYNENHQGPSITTSTPSAPAPTPSVATPPALTVKLKARISTFQIFVLYQDPKTKDSIPTEVGFYKSPAPEVLKADHLKVDLDSMILKYQQWSSLSSSGGQKVAKSSKGQVDFTLSNFSILEWIETLPRPFETESWNQGSVSYRIPPRRKYIPLVEFESDQDPGIQTSPTSKFSTLQVPERYMTERSVASRMKASKKGQQESNRPVFTSATDSSRANDLPAPAPVTKEVVRRMEKLFLAVMGSNVANTPDKASGIDSDDASRPQRSIDQQMMEDLEMPNGPNKLRTRLRLRLNSVQIWVSVPDMALILAGKPDSGPEYRSIHDIIAVNISKLIISQATDSAKGPSDGPELTDPRTEKAVEEHAWKLKIDFASVSAFVIPAHETTSKAVLSIGALPSHQTSSLSGYSSTTPNIEITARLPSSLPIHYERPSVSAFPRVPVVQAFAILEGEENVHDQVDEEEELLLFKQKTLETSLLVVNTHFPQVAVHLEKRILDIFQLRVNDLSTWLTLFSERLASQLPTPPPSPIFVDTGSDDTPLGSRFHPHDAKEGVRRSSLDGGFRDDQSEHGTDQSTAYGEELRYQAEGVTGIPRVQPVREYQPYSKIVKPTMASVLVYAQTVDVILDYPTGPTVLDPLPIVKSYQINAGEARIFTAVHYKGGTDTYLSVDTEDLEFWEITAQKPKALLLTRTIPKTVKIKSPKPMFHMTSLLSFDPALKFKENDTNLSFAGISWKFSIEQTAVDDVQDFFAEPVGIVYLNPLHQCTRVNVSLMECCMDYKPLHIPSRFVLSFEKMKVFATLIPESPTLKSKVQIYNMNLFLIDHTQSMLNPQHPGLGASGPGIDSKYFWRSSGFAMIGQCPFFELKSIKSKNGQLPLYDLTITNQIFYLETCSDSFETLSKFAAYLGDNGDMPLEKKKIMERIAEAEMAANRAKSNIIYQDVLVASLDEDAFRKPKLDRNASGNGTLDIVEGFYAVEQEDSDQDLFKAQVKDTPDIDGFHEVYADLLGGSRRQEKKHDSKATSTKASQSSKIKTKAPSAPEINTGLDFRTMKDRAPAASKDQGQGSRRTSMEGGRRDTGAHGRKTTVNHMEGFLTILDPEAQFAILENHFTIPVLTEEERAKDEGSLAKMRIRVRDFNVSWRLYDGLDWEISRLDEAERKRQARQLANRLYDPNDIIHQTMDSAQSNLEASIFERLSGMQPSSLDRPNRSPSSSEADSTSDYQNDVMSQVSGMGRRPSSASSTSGTKRHQQSHAHHHYGSSHHHEVPTTDQRRRKKFERSKTPMLEFNADKIRIDFEDHIAGVETASHLSVRVKEFEIIDNLKTSLWHKFLSHQRPDANHATPRLTQSNMIRIDLDGVRPVVSASTVEYRLKVKILPLRLYIDQDALIFLIRFFVQGTSNGGSGTPVDEYPPEGIAKVVDNSEKKKPNELYFQSVKLGEIAVKMDYKPKHVDYTGLSGGNFVELMNFFHLDAAEMTLQEVRLHGINGFAKLGQDLIASWLPHIRSTQVPHMVSGLTPIRSLVNLGSGIADLVLLPIEQYKKDGHIIRGLQKGGQAFTRATTLEALKIGTKLAVGTQVLLEHADEIFGSGKAGSAGSGSGSKARLEGGYVVQGSSDHGNGKRVVATMVSDSEAYMQESIDDEDTLLQHLHQQQQQQQQRLHQQQHGSSGSSIVPGGINEGSSSSHNPNNKVSKYANQPADLNEGMELAYKSLSKNIGTAAHTIFAVPMEVYERTGTQGSVRAVIRAVPVAVLKPMIGATEAFSKVLIGIRNSIDPAQRLQMEDKYKRQ